MLASGVDAGDTAVQDEAPLLQDDGNPFREDQIEEDDGVRDFMTPIMKATLLLLLLLLHLCFYGRHPSGGCALIFFLVNFSIYFRELALLHAFA